jgi:hypothetical protein
MLMFGMITPVEAQHLLVTFQTTLAERAERGADDTLFRGSAAACRTS